MAEKKPKKEFSATRKLFNSILGTDDSEKSVDWEGGYKTEVRDHGLTKAKHKMEKKSGNKKKKKAAITRLKKNVENMSLVKPKPKKKNVLIKPAPKPKKEKEFNQGGMSKEELGKNNFKALNSLYDVLDGNGPTALDIASAKKVAEDKVTAGVEQADSKGFDYEPKDKGYQIEGLSLTDKSGDPDYEAMRLEQRRAKTFLDTGNTEALTELAAEKAGIEATDEVVKDSQDADVEAIKERPESSWLDYEKLAIAMSGLIAPLIGYAAGGYEGALHGFGATASGISSYGKSKMEMEKARLKASTSKAGNKTISLTMEDENGRDQDYLFKFDETGSLQPVVNPITGVIATGTKLAQARIEWRGKADVAAIKGATDIKKATIAEGKWRDGIASREKMTQKQIDASTARVQSQIDSREKISRDRIEGQRKKDKAKGASLPIDKKKQVDTLSTIVAKKSAIKSQLEEDLNGFMEFVRVGNIDGAVIHGKNMAKTLNSTEGADAVGVDEKKDLMRFLNHNIFNFTEPGPFWGRDLKGFERQVRAKIKSIGEAAASSQSQINTLLAGGNIAVKPTPKAAPKVKESHKATITGFPINAKRPVGTKLKIKGKLYEVIKETATGSIVKEL